MLRFLLQRARHKYRTAWRHARALGAQRLAQWASQCDMRLRTLIPLETKHAGYAIRARKLGPWAVEVLA